MLWSVHLYLNYIGSSRWYVRHTILARFSIISIVFTMWSMNRNMWWAKHVRVCLLFGSACSKSRVLIAPEEINIGRKYVYGNIFAKIYAPPSITYISVEPTTTV